MAFGGSRLPSMAMRSSPFNMLVAGVSEETRVDWGALYLLTFGGADRGGKFCVGCVFLGIGVVSECVASPTLSRKLVVDVLMLRRLVAADTASDG